MELKWVCLYNDCGHVNQDDFLKTATPTCEVCGQEYWWDQLLTKKQMAAGNALLDSKLRELDVLDELNLGSFVECLVCGVEIGGGGMCEKCEDLSLGYDDNEQEWVRVDSDV